jgi:hypothetical protein
VLSRALPATAAITGLVACYGPTPPTGSPCGPGPCPAPLVCSPASQTCERTAVDAAAPDAWTSPYRAAVLADHPIGYLRMGDAAGATTLRDELGGTTPTTIVGTLGLGAIGALSGDPDTAAAFDGKTTKVTLPSSTWGFAAGAPMSVEAWVWIRPTALPAGLQNNVLRVGKSGSTGYGLIWQHGQVELLAFDDHGGLHELLAPLDVGGYRHVVVSFDGNAGRLYVDGALAAEAPTNLGTSTGGDLTTIGGANNGSAAFFDGLIDELAVYPTAITGDQVLAHFRAGRL